MPATNAGPQGARLSEQQRTVEMLTAQATSIGRYQGPELWTSQNVTLTNGATTQVNVTRPMPLNRPAESILITLQFRVTIANNNFTAVGAESPQAILQQLQITGSHRRFGNLSPIRMSGASLFAWPSLFQIEGNYVQINGIRAADPGVPFVSPFLGNVGTYDIVIVWNVPLGPMVGIGQSSKRDLATFLYQPADWGDSLQAQLTFGDATALGVPVAAAADVTFSAFGSAAGNPLLSMYVNYSILGPFANAIDTGVVVRQEQLFNSFVTAGDTQRISQLQKQITPNVLLKSGLSQAGATGTVFATLVDEQIDRTQIVVDNKPVKFNQSNITMKAYLDRMFALTIPEGYFLLSFVEGQNPLLSYRGDGLAGGSLFELQSDIETSAATNLLALTQEMIYGGPFPALRPL